MQARLLSKSFVLGLSLLISAANMACIPAGRSGGRIDPSSTLPSETGASGSNTADLMVFADSTGENLVAAVLQLREVRDSPTRVVIEMGSVVNKGTDIDRVTFEALQARVRSRLTQSSSLRSAAIVTESLGRMRSTSESIGGGSGDPAVYGGSAPTYALGGTFYMSSRGNTREYFMTFQLVNVKTREIMFEQVFKQKEAS
jgi:hypothetical protein